jgi:hypothetical protein
VVVETVLQQGVAQHCHQGRCHAHGNFKVDAVALEPFKDLQQGNVGFRDRLKQPFFF